MKLTQQQLKRIITEEVQKELLLEKASFIAQIRSEQEASKKFDLQTQIGFLWASLMGLAGEIELAHVQPDALQGRQGHEPTTVAAAQKTKP